MTTQGVAELGRARESYREQAWSSAFEGLTQADLAAGLAPEDLELRATCAYMLGRDADYVESLERAHDAYLERAETPSAVRCGFWIGHSLMFQGERARGAGWFERAKRLLETVTEECVETGYLLAPEWLREMSRGNYQAAIRLTEDAATIGERFDDADLVWLARDDRAKALLLQGRVEEGLRLVDEALVATTMGELSPIVTGIVYCNTISFCSAVYELRHVRAWTRALWRWCERQPEMVAHNGLCLVHRAEIGLLEGDWRRALDEARRATDRYARGVLNQIACGKAFYCQGEVHRLRGHLREAETAYRAASRQGYEPQPGLALMRMAQGRDEAAAAAIRRAVAEETRDYPRTKLLDAMVEIAIAQGDLDRARDACRELTEISERHDCEVIRAATGRCRGATDLARGRAAEALMELRPALAIWTALGARFEIARIRVLVADACRALGDDDTATLEMEAARTILTELGVAGRVGISIVETPSKAGSGPGDAHGLTPRQLEVLRLVATGKTNRQIATELFVSEHTIARHLQNIFARLDVSSRTAASAYAFANDLV